MSFAENELGIDGMCEAYALRLTASHKSWAFEEAFFADEKTSMRLRVDYLDDGAGIAAKLSL